MYKNWKLLRELWSVISHKEKKLLYVVVGILPFAAIIEVLGIGSLYPLIVALSDYDKLASSQVIKLGSDFFGVHSKSQIVTIVLISFISFTVLGGVLRLILLFLQTKISYQIGADFSVRAYKNTLYQPYEELSRKNASELVAVISSKISLVTSGVILPIISSVGNIFVMLGIIVALFLINSIVAFWSAIIFTGIYLFIGKILLGPLREESQILADKSSEILKSINEGLGGIRDIILNGQEDWFIKNYKEVDNKLKQITGKHVFYGASPRYFIETMAIVSVAGFSIYYFTSQGDTSLIIPSLAVIAFSGQRFLPLLQQMYSAYVSVSNAASSLEDVIEHLKMSKIRLELIDTGPTSELLNYDKELSVVNVSFKYNTGEWVLKNTSLNIPKGACIGFIGKSGSGKSTMVDIIMGLLYPTSGSIVVDDVAIAPENIKLWRSKIAHVPQSIYLLDASILENIAFGCQSEDINVERARAAVERAQLLDFIESQPLGFETRVGERGAMLSGGQRQRLALARAFYKDSEVIVFDEATSALDNETEEMVMNALAPLVGKVTILMIAHRLSTLKMCEKIYSIDDGVLVKQNLGMINK